MANDKKALGKRARATKRLDTSPRLCASKWTDILITQPSSLLSLPTEIRRLIWNFALSVNVIAPIEGRCYNPKRKFQTGIRSATSVVWKTKGLSHDTIALYHALSLTCHQTYIEVVDSGLLYQLNRFQFFYPRKLVNFLSTIPQHSRDAIQDIQLAFPCHGPYRYTYVIPPEAFKALCSCSGLRKLSLVIGTSSGDRSCAQHDYTNDGKFAIADIELLSTQLVDCGLVGLEKFDVLLWDPWPWHRDTPGAVVIGSGMWTEEAQKSYASIHMKPALGQVKAPGDFWSDSTKRTLEMLVEKLRTQVTRRS